MTLSNYDESLQQGSKHWQSTIHKKDFRELSLNYADYLGVTLVKEFEVLMCYMIHINLSLSNHEEKPAIFLHLGDKWIIGEAQ